MKSLRYTTGYVAIILAIVFCACGGGGSSSDGGSVPEKPNNIILNAIKENATPVGLSTFSMGVVGKFPLEDIQVAEGVGYKSVARVVRHIATNELYTFPETPSHQQVADTIKFFIDSGHLVTHEIHILNGPSMRKSRDQWINGVMGRKVDDSDFVRALQYDLKVRDAVLNLFSEVVQYARTLEALGATVLICPELEDNQSHSTFKILIDFLNRVGWTDATKIVRNGGYPGEFAGLRYETHNDLDVGKLRPGDIVNNDGNSFIFAGESPSNGEITEPRIRYMVEKAQQVGAIAFTWHTELQGNVQVSPGNFSPYPSYTSRTYKLKNPVSQASILLGITTEEIVLDIKP